VVEVSCLKTSNLWTMIMPNEFKCLRYTLWRRFACLKLLRKTANLRERSGVKVFAID
jgi:hypothetical protein